ncbi:MAG: hypothetical protein ACRDHO_02590 [Actinomycetota bacterium]
MDKEPRMARRSAGGSGAGGWFRASLVIVLCVSSMLVLVARAVLADARPARAGTFHRGALDLSTSPSPVVLSFRGLVPGDKVTDEVVVSNLGSLELRYSVSGSATDPTGLTSQLDLTVKSGVTACTNAGFSADGTVLYGPGDLDGVSSSKLIGDPSQGAQAGDRTLAPSASETLCFQVELPLSTGNSFQNASATATWGFQAEQTADND